MQSKHLPVKRMIWVLAVCFWGTIAPVAGQDILTIERAMDIASENSPRLRGSFMNLERYQQNLIAQRAALKSRFSMNLNPLSYSKNRSFDNRVSE